MAIVCSYFSNRDFGFELVSFGEEKSLRAVLYSFFTRKRKKGYSYDKKEEIGIP